MLWRQHKKPNVVHVLAIPETRLTKTWCPRLQDQTWNDEIEVSIMICVQAVEPEHDAVTSWLKPART